MAPIDELLETLRCLEEELHRTETRRSRERLESLLHPDFEEFGRSGRRYDRSAVLDELAAEGELPEVVARDYELARLGEDLALLTYVSAHADPIGALSRHTLRASLWMKTPSGWKMRFHQGTPTDPSL